MGPEDIGETDLRHAGFWRRLGAYGIDLVITIALSIPVILLTGGFVPGEVKSGVTYYTTTRGYVLLVAFMVLFYKGRLESGPNQATPGKRAFGMIVTDLRGERISYGRAIFRSWPFWLPWFETVNPFQSTFQILNVFALVSCIAVGITAKKQGLHDRMAKCFVLRRAESLSGLQRGTSKSPLQDKPDDNPSFCYHCGTDIPKDSTKCPECGKSIDEATEQTDRIEADEQTDRPSEHDHPLVCDQCGKPWNPQDYRSDTPRIFCSGCKVELVRPPL